MDETTMANERNISRQRVRHLLGFPRPVSSSVDERVTIEEGKFGLQKKRILREYMSFSQVDVFAEYNYTYHDQFTNCVLDLTPVQVRTE